MKILVKCFTIVSLMIVAGCSQTPNQQEKVSLLVPQGAPALSTISIYGSEYADVTTVSGTDVITSELAKEDPSYDMIIAPINLGAKMMEKGNTKYKMHSVVTWGNLYIVGTDAYETTDDFAAFGENAVPSMILKHVGLDLTPTYYNGVQDVQTQLISGKVQAGLMAEPAATATIAKAKEKGIALSVLYDLQEEYQKTNNTANKGYPQAAIFVKVGSEDKVKVALNKIETFLNTTDGSEDELTPLIEKAGVDNLGIPNAQVAIASWQRQNINFKKAIDVKHEITEFLKLFNITFQEDMLLK